jgi:hypothetical protein
MSDEVFEVCGETMFSGSYSALVTTERPPSALELGSNPGGLTAEVEDWSASLTDGEIKHLALGFLSASGILRDGCGTRSTETSLGHLTIGQ